MAKLNPALQRIDAILRRSELPYMRDLAVIAESGREGADNVIEKLKQKVKHKEEMMAEHTHDKLLSYIKDEIPPLKEAVADCDQAVSRIRMLVTHLDDLFRMLEKANCGATLNATFTSGRFKEKE